MRLTALGLAVVSAAGGSVLAVLADLSPSGGILSLGGTLMLAGLVYRSARNRKAR
jgi:hypothetical protein